MDVARINLSHGTTAEHERRRSPRRAALLPRHGSPLADPHRPPRPEAPARGPARGRSSVQAGVRPSSSAPRTDAQLPVNFPELLPHFSAGELVLVDDGAVALRVRAVTPPTVALEVLNDGTIESRKGVNLPDTRLPIGALTAADRELLAWGLRQDVDYVALSFVRSRRRRARAQGAHRRGRRRPARGGQDREDGRRSATSKRFSKQTDAVMVARGDLGVEVDIAACPGTSKANHPCLQTQHGVPVITATQMLDSHADE